jgi:membrane protein
MRSYLFVKDMINKVWKDYGRDDCMILSAAVSFYAIFSVIPFLFLLFMIWGYFVGSSDTLFAQIVQLATELVPDIPAQVMEDIRTVVDHRHALGGVGIFFLLWVFDVVFYSIAHAFDRIFGSGWKRRYYKTKLLSFATLLFVGVVLYASVYLTLLTSAIRNTGVTILGIHISHYVAESLSFQSVVYFLMIGVFAAMFLIVPHREIRARFALLGGFLFVNLWYLAKIGFRWYVKNIAVFNIVYGALGTLVVLVLWIFYSANILLISAECVAFMQDRRDKSVQKTKTEEGRQMVEQVLFPPLPSPENRLEDPQMLVDHEQDEDSHRQGREVPGDEEPGPVKDT